MVSCLVKILFYPYQVLEAQWRKRKTRQTSRILMSVLEGLEEADHMSVVL
jgi:hypothetical protein